MDLNTALSMKEIIGEYEKHDAFRNTIIKHVNVKNGFRHNGTLPIVLIYHTMVELLSESIHLASNGYLYSLPIILRSQSEFFASLCFILQSEKVEEVAVYYYKWSKYKNSKTALNSLRENPKDVDLEKIYPVIDKLKIEIQKYVNENTKEKNEEYILDRSSNWLSYENDIKSTKLLFKKIGYEKLYHVIFATTSSVVHSSGAAENTFSDKNGNRHLGSPFDKESVLTYHVLLLNELYPYLSRYFNAAF